MPQLEKQQLILPNCSNKPPTKRVTALRITLSKWFAEYHPPISELTDREHRENQPNQHRTARAARGPNFEKNSSVTATQLVVILFFKLAEEGTPILPLIFQHLIQKGLFWFRVVDALPVGCGRCISGPRFR